MNYLKSGVLLLNIVNGTISLAAVEETGQSNTVKPSMVEKTWEWEFY